MAYALCAALVVQTVALLVTLDRLIRRHDRQVQELCQRVQAPEVAVAQHAHLEHHEESGYPMADEDLAEAEERARVLAFIERHENGGDT